MNWGFYSTESISRKGAKKKQEKKTFKNLFLLCVKKKLYKEQKVQVRPTASRTMLKNDSFLVPKVVK